MERMGFNEKWINLIMNCITTVTYFVLINGVAHGYYKEFTPRRPNIPILISPSFRRLHRINFGSS